MNHPYISQLESIKERIANAYLRGEHEKAERLEKIYFGVQAKQKDNPRAFAFEGGIEDQFMEEENEY